MIIYKVINKINGKIYVGQTIQSLKTRWRGHCDKSKNTYLANAIRKHGKENFSIEQIDSAGSLEELNDKEKHWIEYYNSRNREIGYNLKEGGDSSPCHEETKIKIGIANSNKSPSIETRKILSEIRKGKPLSEETRRRMSESRKGSKMSEYTKQRLMEGKKNTPETEETRQRRREARLGKKLNPETIEKIRIANTGKKRSQEFRDNMTGKKRPKEVGEKISSAKKGFKHSDESKIRMKANFKGRTGMKNNPESIKKMLETKARKKAELLAKSLLDN